MSSRLPLALPLAALLLLLSCTAPAQASTLLSRLRAHVTAQGVPLNPSEEKDGKPVTLLPSEATLPPRACPVNQVTVTPLDALKGNRNGRTQTQRIGWSSAQKVLDHITTFTGIKAEYARNGGFGGELASPENLPWVNSRSHHLDCWDGRSDYAVVGVPGGEISEFILGLAAIERTRPLSQVFSQLQVESYFEDFISNMPGKFYLHTDAMGYYTWKSHVKKMTGLKDPLKPESLSQRDFALDLAPRYMNCSHLQLMMEKDSEYKVRRQLVEFVIRSAMKVVMDESHRSRSKVEFVILQGYPHQEQAIVDVLSPAPPDPQQNAKGKGINSNTPVVAHGENACHYHTPLILPRLNLDPDQAVLVYHPRAVYEHRAFLAAYFARMEQKDDAWRWKLFSLMTSIGNHQLELTKKYLYPDHYSYVADFRVAGQR